jgi:hypothetical protein
MGNKVKIIMAAGQQEGVGSVIQAILNSGKFESVDLVYLNQVGVKEIDIKLTLEPETTERDVDYLRELDSSVQDAHTEAVNALEKWDKEFDSKNTLNDWMCYVNTYIGNALLADTYTDTAYIHLSKAAGLILNTMANLRAGNVALRHYEKGGSNG